MQARNFKKGECAIHPVTQEVIQRETETNAVLASMPAKIAWREVSSGAQCYTLASADLKKCEDLT